MFLQVNLVSDLLRKYHVYKGKDRTFWAPMLISITANSVRGAAISGLPIAALQNCTKAPLSILVWKESSLIHRSVGSW